MRKRIIILTLIAALAVGCNQFYDQVTVRPYEEPQLQPPAGAEPVDSTEPIHPNAEESARMVEPGRLGYRRYCWPCHGPGMDGNGTVGPSFPRDFASLTDEYVVELKDAKIFEIIGIRVGMHPPIGKTMTAEERWQVIAYIRAVQSGAVRPGAPDKHSPARDEKRKNE